MSRPNVEIIKQVTSLGGSVPARDGVCAIIMPEAVGYAITRTIFTSIEQLADAGITLANDIAHSAAYYRQISDFYRMAPAGTELHLITTAETELVDFATAASEELVVLQNYLFSKSGYIKLLVICPPHGAESTPETKGISQDLIDSIPLLQAFADAEYTRLRPIDIIVEGRNFNGLSQTLQDLRALNKGNVSIVVGQEKAAVEASAHYAKYAAVGLFAGSLAACHVGRNVGRVKSGALPIIEGKFANGDYGVEYGESLINTLNDKGYIFFDKYQGVTGWFWNDDHTCGKLGQSNSQISLNRTLNKASRIAAETYVYELKDEISIDTATGQMTPLTVKTLQNSLQSAIEKEMVNNPDPLRDKECSGVTVYINPAQNILATSKIVVNLSIVPLGIARTISTVVELNNPNS